MKVRKSGKSNRYFTKYFPDRGLQSTKKWVHHKDLVTYGWT